MPNNSTGGSNKEKEIEDLAEKKKPKGATLSDDDLAKVVGGVKPGMKDDEVHTMSHTGD